MPNCSLSLPKFAKIAAMHAICQMLIICSIVSCFLSFRAHRFQGIWKMKTKFLHTGWKSTWGYGEFSKRFRKQFKSYLRQFAEVGLGGKRKMSWLLLFFRTWGLPGDLRKFHPSYFRKAKAQWTTGSGRARDVPPSAGVERAVIRSELPFFGGTNGGG